MSTLVMKFGGASMATPAQFSNIAAIIEKRVKNFSNLVIVASAMGTMTEDLLKLAKEVHPIPPKREQDMLISIGERVSCSLLAMALQFKGIDAISLTGSQSGVITTNEHMDAQILEVRPYRIERAFQEKKVVIVAGFQGMSFEKEITTLGRGGSDISAVALAAALNAQKVELYKDVQGVGIENPFLNPHTEIYSELSYEKALEIVKKGAKILHYRSIELAQKHGVALEIRSFHESEKIGTLIHHM